MLASQFSQFGDPDALSVIEVPNPQVVEGCVVVRVEAASINPSDVKNVAGAMTQTTLPRTPGRDYAGVVEAGPADWIGARVFGTGGDVGFTRDGTHAEKIILPVASLNRIPEQMTFDEAAVSGVNFLTGWCGVVEAAALKAGETLLIIGAGGVGGAAAQIGHHLGAHVIAADKVAPPANAPVLAATQQLLIAEPDLPKALREANRGNGADVVFDTVGGPMLETALHCLARGGRLIVISAAGKREASFDLADFYHNESRMLGVDTLKRDTVEAGRVLAHLVDGFTSGDYRPAPIAAHYTLRDIREAYRDVAKGVGGRVVIHPHR